VRHVHYRAARHLSEPELSARPEFVLRDGTPDDEEFLFSLFVETRGDDFTALPAAQAETLLRMQFHAQRQSYAAAFPGTRPSIIVLSGGKKAGTFWEARLAREYRIVDIAILRLFQRKGIASALVRELIEAARREGVPVRASVAKSNIASLRFHQQLGFAIDREDAVYYQLLAL